MRERFEDKSVLITGASSGNGRAMAKKFAAEGGNIVVADIREDPRQGGQPTHELVEDEYGANALFIETDISDREAFRDTIDQVVEEFGTLDILVNNAGVWPGPQPIDEVDEDEFARVMNINTKGTFFGCQAAVDIMANQEEGGAIVNISSLAGLFGFDDSALYCTSKGGITNLTRELALEFGPDGVRVNAVNPGVIETAMTYEDGGGPGDAKERIPLRALGQPEEVADAVLFLASDEATHVTGVNLEVDGGLAANGY
jgi:NAD(P)-dependent dehydrogenase (short-subunit alcohol dehydrogenase family)